MRAGRDPIKFDGEEYNIRDSTTVSQLKKLIADKIGEQDLSTFRLLSGSKELRKDKDNETLKSAGIQSG